jgi:hypothetical protein
MAVSESDNIILIGEKQLSDGLLDSTIVCIYPEHEKNGVTVRLIDYETLEEICIKIKT